MGYVREVVIADRDGYFFLILENAHYQMTFFVATVAVNVDYLQILDIFS